VLFIAAVVMGSALVYINIALQHLVASLGSAEERTRNVSLQSLAIALGSMTGPFLVGLSIDHQGHVPTYLYLSLLVASSCVGWIACRRLIPHSGKPAEKPAGGRARDLLRQPDLRRTIVAGSLVIAGIDLYAFYMPIYGHGIGLSATMIGVVLGAFASATFVVRILLPRLVRRLGEERTMTASLYMGGAVFLLFPFVHQVPALLVLSFALGLGLGVGQPLSLIMTYNRAPAGRAGEALGVRFSVVNFTHMVIPLVFGSIGSALGLIPVFAANSAMLLGGGYAHQRGTRHQR